MSVNGRSWTRGEPGAVVVAWMFLALGSPCVGCGVGSPIVNSSVLPEPVKEDPSEGAVNGIVAPSIDGRGPRDFLRDLENVADHEPRRLLPFLKDERMTVIIQSSTRRVMRLEHPPHPVWQVVDALLHERYGGAPHGDAKSAAAYWERALN